MSYHTTSSSWTLTMMPLDKMATSVYDLSKMFSLCSAIFHQQSSSARFPTQNAARSRHAKTKCCQSEAPPQTRRVPLQEGEPACPIPARTTKAEQKHALGCTCRAKTLLHLGAWSCISARNCFGLPLKDCKLQFWKKFGWKINICRHAGLCIS